MKKRLCLFVSSIAVCVQFLPLVAAQQPTNLPWPPALPGASNGTVTVTSDLFLKIPAAVTAALTNPAAAPFVVAKTPPTIDLAFHGSLPDAALNGTGWSAWGDICVAGDGRVYSGIGDHGDDIGGRSHAFLYRWDPAAKVLAQIVDLNAIVPRGHGEPTWSKVHARINEGADGSIYFIGTLNDGNLASEPSYKAKWSEAIPGGQLYRYDPKTGKTELFANLPPARCTATCLIDRDRNIWWCNLEGGSNAIWALNLTDKKPVFKAPDGSMGLNRNFALAHDGAIYFNGPGGAVWKYDPKIGNIAQTKSVIENGGMRSSTSESKDGYIYGVAQSPGRLFRYSPSKDKVDILGPDFLTGDYTTVCVLSSDGRFLYYLPGAHGGAFSIGTPVVQYSLAARQRKVIAFVREGFETACGYVPAGSYGVKLSADDGTLYVNFNGHAADAVRPAAMHATGFGLTSFAAIHIPASERK